MNKFLKLALCVVTSVIAFAPLMASAAVTTCSSVSYQSASGVANDIVFKFDKAYQCGKFANGDYWVTPYPEKTLQIVSITPNAASGMHGYEVNPSSKSTQALDFRMTGYTPTLQPALPLALSGDVSLVKAVSVPYDPLVKSCNSANRPCLQHAAVLTVTANPVANSTTTFRPGYFGYAKKFYSTASITSKKFAKFPTSCCSEVASATFLNIKNRYRRVQLDHLAGWTGRSMHPIDNMPDYGADIATNNAIALLRMMMSDFYITNLDTKQALVNYLQMAVDLQSMAANGATWNADGGHSNGRKLPLVFAGWLLGDPSFQDAVVKGAFSEDQQVYFSPKANTALFGRDCGAADRYWQTTVKGTGTRDCRDPYGLIDGGGKEIGSAYQFCCTAKPWKYTALAIKALGLQAQWNNAPFMQYVERYVKQGVKALPDTCSPYDGMATNYNITYGTGADGNCVPGAGRWASKDGTNIDAGQYSYTLGDQMWAYWAKTYP